MDGQDQTKLSAKKARQADTSYGLRQIIGWSAALAIVLMIVLIITAT